MQTRSSDGLSHKLVVRADGKALVITPGPRGGASADEAAGPRILIVAGRFAVEHLIRVTLDNPAIGFTHVSHADAVIAARRCRPHLIILDGGDEPVRGAAVLGAIRGDADIAGTAVLILAYGSHARGGDWLRAGADDCMTGHIDRDVLRSHADRLLGPFGVSVRDVSGQGDDAWREMSRTLHDEVMQRLFAIGMRLEAISRADEGRAIGDRIGQTVVDLDCTIRTIRTAIFESHNES